MANLDRENESDEQPPTFPLIVKSNLWTIGLHLIGGGILFNAWQASRELPDLGVIPTFTLIAVGFLGSKLLVSMLLEIVTRKSYRIAILVRLLPTYFLLAVLLSSSIDQVFQ